MADKPISGLKPDSGSGFVRMNQANLNPAIKARMQKAAQTRLSTLKKIKPPSPPKMK